MYILPWYLLVYFLPTTICGLQKEKMENVSMDTTNPITVVWYEHFVIFMYVTYNRICPKKIAAPKFCLYFSEKFEQYFFDFC
jgi:hypothetical protein